MGVIGVLRDIKDDELSLILSWRNDPSVRNNMYTRHEITMEEHFSWWNKIRDLDSVKYFMYEYNNTPMGVVGFTAIDFKNRNAFWAFYSSPEALAGTGVRMECLALDYAFSNLALHKLNCEVLAYNKPVIRLHEKFGFKVEGILREHHFVDDIYVDIYKMGILKNEWAVNRDSIIAKLSKIRK